MGRRCVALVADAMWNSDLAWPYFIYLFFVYFWSLAVPVLQTGTPVLKLRSLIQRARCGFNISICVVLFIFVEPFNYCLVFLSWL